MRIRKQKISAFLLLVTVALHSGKLVGMVSIHGKCNDDIRLPCKATDHTNMYRYVIWYKKNTQGKTPIIKNKNFIITLYNNLTSVSLGEKESLELRNVMPSDSGEYECYLTADVGGRNRESFIRLNISECVYKSTVYPTTIITTVSFPSVAELSVHWAVLGLTLISLGKIILCIGTLGVCERIMF